MKKNCIKSILSLRLFAVVLLLSASSTVFGQELIRGTIDVLLTDTSIIRVKTNDSVLICNRKPAHSSFMNITSVLTNSIVLYLDSFYVNDFEYVSDFGTSSGKIYFCGYKIENGIKKAVCGRFPFSVFTSIPPVISYYEVDTCTSFNKLEVCMCQEFGITDTHLVMIGSTGTRPDALVDLCMISNSPATCKISCVTNETECLDDIVITKNHVYVSSRREEAGIPVVVFKEYHKPDLLGSHIFSFSYINTMIISSPIASTPVYLDHKTLDVFAAVFKEEGYSRMVMLEVNAASGTINSVEILGDSTQTIHPTEIKYNSYSDVYDILARIESIQDIQDEDYLYPEMRIYHITPAVSSGQASYGDGTWYYYNGRYYRLWSIDPLKSSDYFVASGAYVNLTRMFRYKYNEWKMCPRRFEYRYDIGTLKVIEKMENITKKKINPKKYAIELDVRPFPLEEDCGK